MNEKIGLKSSKQEFGEEFASDNARAGLVDFTTKACLLTPYLSLKNKLMLTSSGLLYVQEELQLYILCLELYY